MIDKLLGLRNGRLFLYAVLKGWITPRDAVDFANDAFARKMEPKAESDRFTVSDLSERYQTCHELIARFDRGLLQPVSDLHELRQEVARMSPQVQHWFLVLGTVTLPAARYAEALAQSQGTRVVDKILGRFVSRAEKKWPRPPVLPPMTPERRVLLAMLPDEERRAFVLTEQGALQAYMKARRSDPVLHVPE